MVLKYDDVITQLGDFGKYQRIVFFLICLPLAFEGMRGMSPVFLLGIPNYRCAIPELANDTYSIQGTWHSTLIDRYIPLTDEGDYSQCYLKKYNSSDNIENSTSTQQIKCDRWVYDKTEFLDTVITETDLVCDRTIFRAHATVSSNVGVLVSFVALGALSDRCGRKLATLIELALLGTFSCLLTWLPNIYVFIVIRLFNGLGSGIFYGTCFVYAMEFVGPSKRTLCGMLQNFFWSAGILIQAVLAYYIRSWRALQLAISIPIFGFLLYWWYLPNSGRWLMANGRREECEKVFRRMSEVNKKNLVLDMQSIEIEKEKEPSKPESFFHIFRSRTLTVRCLIVFWNWYTVSLLYSGLNLNVGNLSGNFYANFAISCGVETVGYVLCFPGLHWLGRKKFYCACMITGGLLLLGSIIQEEYGTHDTEWTVIMLAMIGKLVSSAAYATVYLFSAELFPTVARSRTMGLSAGFATIGGITSPYIVELANILQNSNANTLPLVIFGAASLVAGLLALILPETSKAKLPESIFDMKQMGKNNHRFQRRVRHKRAILELNKINI